MGRRTTKSGNDKTTSPELARRRMSSCRFHPRQRVRRPPRFSVPAEGPSLHLRLPTTTIITPPLTVAATCATIPASRDDHLELARNPDPWALLREAYVKMLVFRFYFHNSKSTNSMPSPGSHYGRSAPTSFEAAGGSAEDASRQEPTITRQRLIILPQSATSSLSQSTQSFLSCGSAPNPSAPQAYKNYR